MSSDLKVSDIDLMYLATDKISRLAIMTLIYRAIPASADSGHGATFIPKCIETAREALEVHRNCVVALNETDNFTKTSYMHWLAYLKGPAIVDEMTIPPHTEIF